METLKSLTGSSFRWSLPCDVNSSVVPTRPYPFLEEAKKNMAMKEDKKYTSNDVESSLEAQRLLDHDSLAQSYQEQQEITIVPRFTSKATLQISATPVDDPISLELDSNENKSYDLETLQTKVLRSKYSVYIPTYKSTEERKVDENGNALHQNPGTKTKKKKIQTDKNVVVLAAESVEGHRSDIINDVDKLIQYIRGDKDDNNISSRTRTNVHKSKQLHKQHTSEDGPRSKKQRAHSSKGKEGRSELKKSNSLGEISTAKLDEFAFVASTGSEKDGDGKVVLRNMGQVDRPKERRSWGNVEPPPFQILSSNASTENLEATENWVVTKPKKKSKKRRNSVSSGRRQNSSFESNAKLSNRAPSPDLRGKSACSAPHSEKSNDSSDVDSVHSLPIDGLNVPISYADIAKNSEKLKDKKVSPEKHEKVSPEKLEKVSPEKFEKVSPEKLEKVPNKEKSPKLDNETKLVMQQTVKKVNGEKHLVLNTVINDIKNAPTPVLNTSKMPPNVHNINIFPAIPFDPHKSLPPDVNDDKNFPAISLETLSPKSLVIQDPKISPSNKQEVNEVNSVKAALIRPPDFYDTKSFPAIPPDSNKSKTHHPSVPDVNNFQSFPAISNNVKSCSVEKANIKNICVSGRVKNILPGDKNIHQCSNVNNNILNSTCIVQNDIQSDLTIIHSNERESIQFNAQMLPPNIPDVQTIEKMHFLNRPPPTAQQQMLISTHSPVSAHDPHEAFATPALPPQSVTNSIHSNNTICDSSERTICEDDERPPPVVILSGIGNKEVTGLVFGFDVNEQLLNEDICENFISRYVAPEVFNQSLHNHDKIVNFIGSAWEAIVNQSNGKVQYYKEES
ncbi:hypothetical protein JTB14_019840 [Gonioctena quinquepunctata]|nr:hypothetical protein JTB14_019840 [Gonioctena quinquepunctata]